jgi:hypothetical protein
MAPVQALLEDSKSLHHVPSQPPLVGITLQAPHSTWLHMRRLLVRSWQGSFFMLGAGARAVPAKTHGYGMLLAIAHNQIIGH